MTTNHLSQAIQECDNGQLLFDTRSLRSFLYNNKWYPLRVVINRALSLADEPADLTTDRCLVELVRLDIWIRICDVNFANSLPLPVSRDEMNREVKSLAKVLATLVS